MLFNSFEFAIFLPLVFFTYWLVFNNHRRAQNILIICASYLFYGWWDYRFLGLIFISSIVDYSIGIFLLNMTNSKLRKMAVFLSILVNLSLLGIFKYYDFFVSGFREAFLFFGLDINVRTLNLILPVGISFYTFQTMSYTIDIHKGKMKPTRSLIDFLAFVSFFPQLVAGPIERASSLLPQFSTNRKFNIAYLSKGMALILWGLFKKIVIADNTAIYVNQIFDNYEIYSGLTLFIGAFLFSFQIYCDFSGYSDIAIGSALLFGFELMRNFNYPYFSVNIVDFWRRWHISLSSWFRDYVYIPLGGGRGTAFKKNRNILVVFVVSGIWHGANWTFLLWGFLHAVYYQAFGLFNKGIAKRRDTVNYRNLGVLLNTIGTFLIVTLGWIFFRSETIFDAFSYLESLFLSDTFYKIEILTPKSQFIYTFLLLAGFILFEWYSRHKYCPLELNELSPIKRWSVYYVVFLLIITFGYFGKNEFIYFAF